MTHKSMESANCDAAGGDAKGEAEVVESQGKGEDFMRCQVCGEPIDGTPFTLSNLDEPPGPLRVCEACAGAEREALERL